MKTLLQDGVAEQAQARPEATALVWKGTRMSYGELEDSSNRLAQLLVDAGCEQGDRVGLLMPKMPAAIVGMLGALKADMAYVPLQPADPPARLARTLETADCRWVLAAGTVDRALRETLAIAQLARPPLLGWLDADNAPPAEPQAVFTLRDLAAFPENAPASVNNGNSLAHILFTSGSTGTPKGVMIAHANAVHFIDWATKYFGITAQDRISQHAPLRFDVATFDIFGTLCSGGELHLVPAEVSLLPHKLAQFIRDAQLTQWFSVPSVLNLVAKFDVLRDNDLPALRRVLFAGEVLPTPTLIYWMRRVPHAQFTNLYGPTETTISSSYYTIPCCPADERAAIPIGTACDGEELLVLDEQLQPAADGEIGDLYIAGAGLSPGYWRDAHRTREAFIVHADGTGLPKRIYKTGDRARREAGGLHYFAGRADMQIKSRGYRIELGEIEAALHTLPELRESAAVAIESEGFEGSLICCAYAPDAGAGASLKQLRTRLAELLPGYMLPVRWMRYDALPKNPNGKLDRPRLAEAFRQAEAPREGSGGERSARSRSGRRHAMTAEVDPPLQPS